MSDYLLRSHEFTTAIDALTLEIEEKVKREEYDNLNELVLRSVNLLTELVALADTDTDKAELLKYLVGLEKREQVILQTVNKEYEMVRHTLSNIDNIKKYVSALG
jgi:hypothetical protein